MAAIAQRHVQRNRVLFSQRTMRSLTTAPVQCPANAATFVVEDTTPKCDVVLHSSRNVNVQYVPDQRTRPQNPIDDNSSGLVSPRHWDEDWSMQQLQEAAENNIVATWGSTRAVSSTRMMERGEGVYVYDKSGNKYLDWTSQAVCANVGHTVPPAIKEAVIRQLDTLPMVQAGTGLTEVRLRLAHLLSELCPGDINGFVFPTGGGEANEAAIRIARRFTGKHKILNQYRSYHGGSTATLAATGDFRRWFAEAGASGFVKMFNPQPFGFKWGSNDKEKTEILLDMLDEQIRMEGPSTIAAIMLEPIVGAGGALVLPAGYMQGVRALCDKYDILLIIDEVMMGFGRTGKFWGFQHYEGVIPDIVTSAKGLTSAYLPLAMLGMRQKIKDFFMDNPLGWGATYANHPVALACAYEVVKHVVKENLAERAASFEPLMVEHMQNLVNKHSCVRQARAVGLFGCLDLIGPDGNMIQEYQQTSPPNVVRFRKAMLDNGLYGLFRPPLLHCAPPLIIQEHELSDGFSRLDESLKELDF